MKFNERILFFDFQVIILYICEVLKYNYKLIFKIMITSVILVNDPLVEKTLVDSIGKFSSIEIIDILFDKVTATERLNQLHTDLLFVDVDDPAIGSIKLTEVGNQPGASFAITANGNSDHILSLLDEGYFDVFMMQNFTFETFCKKMNKMMKSLYYLQNKGVRPPIKERFSSYPALEELNSKEGMFVRCGKTNTRVNFADILYVKNIDSLLKIHLISGKVVYHNSTLRKFIKDLPANQFVRINNSTIVNYTRVDEFSRNTVSIFNHTFPVTKSYIDLLRKVLRL